MLPSVNFLNRSVSVPFDVTAYPVPNSLTFAFLGSSTPQTDYDGITLTGSCRQKGDKLYISVCTVTVDNMTSSAAAGFYQVTVANGQGQALFTIQIKYNGQYIINVVRLSNLVFFGTDRESIVSVYSNVLVCKTVNQKDNFLPRIPCDQNKQTNRDPCPKVKLYTIAA